jgi:hypothetical protein
LGTIHGMNPKLLLLFVCFYLVGCNPSDFQNANIPGVANLSYVDLKASVSPSLNSFQDAEYSSQSGMGVSIPESINLNTGGPIRGLTVYLSLDQIQCTYFNKEPAVIVEKDSVNQVVPTSPSNLIGFASCSDGSTVGTQRTVYTLKLHIDESSTTIDSSVESKISIL